MSERTIPHRYVSAALFAILLVGLTILCRDVFFRGEVLCGPDTVNYFIPTAEFARPWVGEGILPLWNPMTFCGWPLVGDPQLRWLYPPSLLLQFLPPAVAFTALVVLYLVFAGLGMWLYLRIIAGATRPGALCGTASFVLAGFLACHLMSGIVVFPATAAWLPWILLLGWRVGRSGTSAGTIVLLAIAVGCQICSGAPQIVYYTWFVLGLIVVWRFIGRLRRPASLAQAIRIPLVVALACIAGALLAAPSLLPTLEFGRLSFQRGGEKAFELVTNTSMAPRYLWLLVAPRFFFDPRVEATYWAGEEGYWEVCGYLGIGPLVAALIALFGWRRLFQNAKPNRDRSLHSGSPNQASLTAFHLLIAILAILLALGRHSPLFRLLYHTVPGFDWFRVPARWLLVMQFGLSAVFAVVLDRIVFRRHGAFRLSAPALGPAIVLFLFLLICAVRTTDLLLMAGIETYFPRFNPTQSLMHERLRNAASFSLARGAVLTLLWCGLFAGAASFRRKGFFVFGSAAVVVVFLDLLSFSVSLPETLPREEVQRQFFRRSELITFLDEGLDDGRYLAVDNVHSYLTDQNQPEIWANRAEVHGIRDARGYYPICLRWFGQFVNALSDWAIDEPQGGQLFVGPPLATRRLPLANVKFVLSYFSGSYPSLRLIKQFDFGLMVYVTPGYMGPAWLADAVELGDATDAESFEQLKSAAIDFTRQALVLGSLPETDAARDSETTGSIRSFQRVSPNRFRIGVEPGRRSLLVVSEVYHPGWHARIDGRPAPVLRTNHAFLGVSLPADGKHVEIAFEPFSFRIGLYLSLVAILILSASILVVLRRRTAP